MMKFRINKKPFHQAIQSIIGVVPVKTTIPILSNILLDLQGEQLSLTGTDLEVSISTKLTAQGERDGSVAIPAKILFEIVRELPDIPMELDCDEDFRITLKTEKGFYKLSGESKEDFPKITIEDTQGSFQLSTERLARMVEKTLFAVSSDELRTTLMGVYMKVMDNELRMVSTDGHRLVKMQDKSFVAPGFDNETIIPTKALNLLLKNLGSSENVDISLSSDHIVFALEGTTIFSKSIDGTFPSYERVIPTDNDKKMTVNRDLLSSSVKRVSIFSNSITHQIRLSLSSGQLQIQSEDIEFGGEAEESIEVEYGDEAIDIGYNANYLLDILRHLDTDDIDIKLKDSTSAGVFFPANQNDNEEILMLLMPIRLNEA